MAQTKPVQSIYHQQVQFCILLARCRRFLYILHRFDNTTILANPSFYHLTQRRLYTYKNK
nr:MAG TPA: hypothetical protein [Caudoviricetes sp.]